MQPDVRAQLGRKSHQSKQISIGCLFRRTNYCLIPGMIKHCPNDLKPGPYVRTADELKSANYDPVNKQTISFLDFMASLFLKAAALS